MSTDNGMSKKKKVSFFTYTNSTVTILSVQGHPTGLGLITLFVVLTNSDFEDFVGLDGLPLYTGF